MSEQKNRVARQFRNGVEILIFDGPDGFAEFKSEAALDAYLVSLNAEADWIGSPESKPNIDRVVYVIPPTPAPEGE